MKKIVHLITHDKFTAGYINFMKLYMTEYDHVFVVSSFSCSNSESIDEKLVNEDGVIRWSNDKWLAFGKEARKIIGTADKIIVSGIFGLEQMIYFWPRSAFKKMYLHYWGGDFYQMRDIVPLRNYRLWIYRHKSKVVFKKAVGAIFLIEGEYEKYQDITGISKDKVFVAEMPGDPLREFDYSKHRNEGCYNPLRIVIGNSASNENNHLDIFEKLKHLREADIEIYCPLSYGDLEYSNEVQKAGKDIFGEKFHALTEWMNSQEYYSFLATCPVGIFNCNRQQALGNISALLQLGNKIYLRSDTSMYANYRKQGFHIYDVDELEKASVSDLCEYAERDKNIEIADSLRDTRKAVQEWKKVFED